jgi:transposase
MSRNHFTEHQIKELEKNPNVVHASDRSISFSPSFKLKAVHEYNLGKTSSQIFSENRFDLNLIEKNNPKDR